MVQSRILANNMVTQTERTAYQTEVSNQHLQKAQEQLEAMKVQAEQTDKQSKILMVFTIVTIIFVGPVPGRQTPLPNGTDEAVS